MSQTQESNIEQDHPNRFNKSLMYFKAAIPLLM